MKKDQWEKLLSEMDQKYSNASRRYRRYNLSYYWKGVIFSNADFTVLEDKKN